MKYFDLSGNRPPSHWVMLAAASLIAVAIAGCGGSDGAAGAAGATGATGAAGAPGANGTNLIATVNMGSNAAPASTATAAAWKALAPQVTVTNVTVNGAPVVKFTVKDAAGNPVLGLANYSQASTATVKSLANLSFTFAKLVPATTATVTSGTTTKVISTEPSKWVTYLVTKPVTVAQAAGTIAAADSCNNTATAAATWCGTYPAADTQGTLVDNGDGSYQYTFYRDPTQAAAIVASLNDSADGLSKKADLGDLTYNANLTHRLGIFISGNAPGTGTNTPNAVAFAATATAVPMVQTFNMGYDFIPATGQPVVVGTDATRDVVQKSSCSGCHDGKGIGHASTTSSPGDTIGRNDPRLCVTCHTDQIKYSFDNPAYTNGEAPMVAGTNPATVNGYTFATLPSTATTAQKRAAQAIVGGRAVGNYPNLIHKTHMGDELVKQAYNFNANGGAQQFNTVGFPQMPSNCTTCHDGSATKSDGSVNANKTTDGDNWKNIPSMLACGACHDGINFVTGNGATLADKAKDLAAGSPIGTTQSGHAGLAKPDNSTCALCHDATTIPVGHRPNTASLNNPVVKAGISSFDYDVKTVTRNGTTGQPTIVFQIKQDGVAVTSFAVPTLVTNAQTGQQVVSPAFEPIAGFASAPSLYVAYAVPEDGIAKPADFNTYQSVSLTNLLVASGSPKAGTLTGPDANGYWTATLTGDLVGQSAGVGCAKPVAPAVATCVNTAVLASPIVVPANAVMLTGAIIGSFTQKVSSDATVPWAFPYTAANVSVNPTTSATGGLYRPGLLKKMVATGYTARRLITDMSKCNSCHDKLGTSPAFHGQSISGQVVAGTGVRNDPTACNICHNNTRTSNGWIANSNTFIHGIHGASERTVPYTWAAVSATDNYSMLGYPGILKDCNQCHLANTVNFGANGMAVQPNLMWPTGATGKFDPASTTAYRNSPYIVVDNTKNYGNGFSFTPAGATVASYTTSTGTVVPAAVAGAGGVTVAADPATLVSSPIAAACFSCHDTQSAKNHMVTNGGAVYEARSTALLKGEACLVCHGAGAEFDAAVVHK